MRSSLIFCLLTIVLNMAYANAIINRYYTDFSVDRTNESLFFDHLYAFLGDLCLRLPGVPCYSAENITVTFAA